MQSKRFRYKTYHMLFHITINVFTDMNKVIVQWQNIDPVYHDTEGHLYIVLHNKQLLLYYN